MKFVHVMKYFVHVCQVRLQSQHLIKARASYHYYPSILSYFILLLSLSLSYPILSFAALPCPTHPISPINLFPKVTAG